MLHCAALAAPPKVYSHRPAESCSWGFLNDCRCEVYPQAAVIRTSYPIGEAVDGLREQGEDLTDEDLSHISLLPYRHVLPNGTYFVDAP